MFLHVLSPKFTSSYSYTELGSAVVGTRVVGEDVVGSWVVGAWVVGLSVVDGAPSVVDGVGTGVVGLTVVTANVVSGPSAGHQVPAQARQFRSLRTHHPESWWFCAWHQLCWKSGPQPHSEM